MYALNTGDAGEDAVYPYYDPGSKTVDDPNAKVDRITKILGAGIPLSKSYVYETIEAPAPGAEDELFEQQSDDKIYPKALALASMITNGCPSARITLIPTWGYPGRNRGQHWSRLRPPTRRP